jgi:hypothetical protein
MDGLKKYMSYNIQYHKKEVIQGLRYHFMKQSEIKVLMVVVNIYAIATAYLLYVKKIRPELFLLGSVLWMVLMLLFWYLIPFLFYRKTELFKWEWTFSFNEEKARLYSEKGEAEWNWAEVTHYFDSPLFFHFYFSAKSFFIIPKQNIAFEDQHLIRGLLKGK